jgi:predicted negative regulator of RcsB-dependent stress response
MEINDHLGDAYFRTGRHEEAKLVWERALSLRGDRILVEEIRKKLEKNFNYKK